MLKRLFLLILLLNISFAQSGQYDFKLVEFKKLPTVKERLEWQKQGFILTDYYPKNKYFAAIDKNFGGLKHIEKIKSVSEVPLKMRANHNLLRGNFPAYAVEGDNLKIVVVYYKVLQEEEILPQLQNLGFEKTQSYKAGYAVEGTLPKSKLEDLLKLSFIQYVDFTPPPAELENDYYAGGITRANYIQRIDPKFNAEGISVMVSEGRVDSAVALSGRLVVLNTGSSVSNHATRVAWHMGGAPIENVSIRNNAWGATIYSENAISNYGDYYDTYNILYTNHSLGYGISGGYSWYARMLDNLSQTYPYIAVCYSAGNSGTSTGFAPYNGFSGWANITGQRKQNKNQFETGATDKLGALTYFSSRGPTYDGRVYPVVVTEGSGGTSFASPKTTGSLAILQKAWLETHPGDSAEAVKLRSILTVSADDEIENPGIDFKTGYGMINLRRAYRVIQNDWIITDSSTTGETDQFTINVPANSGQLRVMLMWPDYPAAVGAPKALVNDLDVFLVSPTNDTILPWVLNHYPHPDSLIQPAKRKKDTLNNAELVTVDQPAAGNWTVVVKGSSVPMGPQKYYIAYEKRPKELVITFPSDSTALLSKDPVQIYWDYLDFSGGNFLIKYQVDNGSWLTIANLPNTDRAYEWTPLKVPDGIHTIKLVIENGSLSDTVICFMTNEYTQAYDACSEGSIIWDSLALVSDYDVYYLDSTQMKPITSGITKTSTSATITSLDLSKEQRLAVVPKDGSRKGYWVSNLVKNNPPTTLNHFQGFENDAVGTAGETVISKDWQLIPSSEGYEWTVNSGSTPSTYTGPSSALEGNNYIYTEGSIGNLPEQTAILLSPCIIGSQPQISYYYHMYVSNTHIKGLFLDVMSQNNRKWIPIDSIKTKQQYSPSDPWAKSIKNLGNTGAFRVRFRAIRAAGNSYNSDYALDSIYIKETGYEIATTTISSPNSGCSLGNENITFTIKNTSPNTIPAGTSIPVEVYINGTLTCSETFNLSSLLAPNSQTSFTFSSCTANLSIPGTYIIKVVSKLSSDYYYDNDTATKTVQSYPSYSQTIYDTICSGDSVLFNGNYYKNPGTYNANFTTIHGCDSIITLNLTVKPNTTASISPTACGSYTTPSGQVLTTSGTYYDTIPNSFGCDSIITINLTINNNTTASISPTACGSYTTPSGQVLTTSGTYYDTIPNSFGCDSIITINLTVVNVDTTVIASEDTLIAQQTNATYQWIDCNSNAPVSGATQQSFVPTQNGYYAVVITYQGCTDTSGCHYVVVTGLISTNGFIKIYPNPTKGKITIEASVPGNYIMKLYDVSGKLIHKDRITLNPKKEVQLNSVSKGVYLLELSKK